MTECDLHTFFMSNPNRSAGARRTHLLQMAYPVNFIAVSKLPPTTGGGYRWWFTSKDAAALLKPFNKAVQLQDLMKCSIKGLKYYAMYVGTTSDLMERCEWHLKDHNPASIRSKTLSNLRHTIGALLGLKCAFSQKAVSDILSRCYFEWIPLAEYKEWEKNELSTTAYSYPLNIQNNKTVSKQVIQRLKELREQYL